MENPQGRVEKVTEWGKDDGGRPVRIVKIRGHQYTQWDHENGPMERCPQRPAQRQETPRYNPTPVADIRRTNANKSSGDQSNHGHGVNYAPYSGDARSIFQDPRTSQPIAQAQPYSLFPMTETSQQGNATQIPGKANDMHDVPSRDVHSGSHQHGSKNYTKPSYGAKVAVEVAVSRRAVSDIPSPAVRSSTKTSESRYSETARNTVSYLSELAQRFIQIPYRDYPACEEFMARYPKILDENLDNFQLEALRLQSDGKTLQVLSCVQQLLLLRKISKLSHNEAQVFFTRMGSKDPTTFKSFIVDFDRIYDALKAEAEARQSDPTQSIEKKSVPVLANSHPKEQGQVPPSARHAPERTRRPSFDDVLSPSMEKLKISTHNQQDPAQNFGAGGNGTRPWPVTSRSSNGGKKMLPPVNEALPTGNQAAPKPPTVEDDNFDIQGDGSEQEELDHRYHVRSDWGKFFKIGRIFAMLWHEGVGGPKGGHLSIKEPFRQYRAGRFGEKVYSHILRMAVVRVRHGYCWCLPIHTYNDQGVTKRGFNQQDQEAHAIIHMDDTQPGSNISGETQLMTKKPIAVRAANSDQKLRTMSRLNFGAPCSVQMNVKVMNVGTITPGSMPAFESYWLNELERN